MNRFQRGFTLFELIFVIVWLAFAGAGIYLLSLVVRALLKYIGG
jgi:prepilin-type N-terminal cleavage/methylation domain-containing protein